VLGLSVRKQQTSHGSNEQYLYCYRRDLLLVAYALYDGHLAQDRKPMHDGIEFLDKQANYSLTITIVECVDIQMPVLWVSW
jgi:hypothetical protein